METNLLTNCLLKLAAVKKHIAVLTLLVLMSFGALYAQDQKLYIAMGDLGPAAKGFMNNNSINNVFTFNVVGKSFDLLDKDKLTADIKTKFPNTSDSGVGALDLEGSPLSALVKLPGSNPDFKAALEYFLNVLKLAKAYRPNVKWGFYALPVATYWQRDSLKNNLAKIEPLLKQCDVFLPSFYTYYKDAANTNNEAFANDNLKAILPVAQRLNKPVLPFVWHRYHVSNKTLADQLIPIDEFKTYLSAILNSNYNNKRVAGLVWWGTDTYGYRIKSKPVLDEFAASKYPDFASYHDALVIKYGTEMLNTIHGKK